jgi:hypothetical protein
MLFTDEDSGREDGKDFSQEPHKDATSSTTCMVLTHCHDRYNEMCPNLSVFTTLCYYLIFVYQTHAIYLIVILFWIFGSS